jgi:hypothetical protein
MLDGAQLEMTRNVDQLRSIQTFEELIPFLEDDLDWPFPHGSQDYEFDDLTFEYTPDELGLEDEYAAKIKRIHQLRPLVSGQPWGIFFVEFENKKLPIVVLRRILSHLVLKQRKSANPADRARWNAGDLLFISAFAEEGTLQREIAFAHFHQDPGDQPTLRVLGWDGGDTPLKLEHVFHILKQRLSWPRNPADHAAWRNQWAGAFRYRIGQQIQTADLLARELARVARNIRDAAMKLMKVESSLGPLRRMHEAFRVALIHDLTPEGFADTYAQTITYGLLTAAISRTDMSAGADGTHVLAEDIHNMVPITNPFLKEMLESFLKVGGRGTSQQPGLDFDELGVQEVVEILRSSEIDLPAVLEDFGKKNPGEDPVIRFYEDFLKAYNKELKIKRGVFYTPQPVVSYIVRSIHEQLQTVFGLPDGLASTITWSEMVAKMAVEGKSLAIPEGTSQDSPFVVILDPATGTATFLVEVIDLIFQTLAQRWRIEKLTPAQQDAEWNRYVPAHLLPRIFGYELLMAPYAIAHMKVGLKLGETGYKFNSDQRVRVYLTNALEPAHNFSERLAFDIPALAHEAIAVNEIKVRQRFTVVLGNPPYSVISANMFDDAKQLIEPYRFVADERIVERSMLRLEMHLQDDYIKFLAFWQAQLRAAGIGVLGVITNNGYADNLTLRGVRWNILAQFQRLYILDLHGDRGRAIGAGDENVFEIDQGVAILIAVGDVQAGSAVSYSDLRCSQKEKLSFLASQSLATTKSLPLRPGSPNFFLIPRNDDNAAEYGEFESITNLMPANISGIVTAHDKLVVDFSDEKLLLHGTVLSDPTLDDSTAQKMLCVKDNAGWKFSKARASFNRAGQDIRSLLHDYAYRPFDTRRILYSSDLVWCDRKRVMKNILQEGNVAIATCRQLSSGPWEHVFITQHLQDDCYISNRTRERSYHFPLRIVPDTTLLPQTAYPEQVNFGPAANKLLELCGGDIASAPLKVFDYIYAILNSKSYRIRYEDQLKIDFPRIPMCRNSSLFSALSSAGQHLRTLHLSGEGAGSVTYLGTDAPLVSAISFDEEEVMINAHGDKFIGVVDSVWTYQVGSYRPCHKWLKDRMARALSLSDISHYCTMINSISETIRISSDIDALIEEQGGWPAAFA